VARARIGVVLPIPEPVAGHLDVLRRALGSSAVGRTVPHVTLVPPVNLPAGQLVEAQEVVAEAAAGCGPLALELGPVATFWPDSPVVHLSVDDSSGRVAVLHDRLRRGVLSRAEEWPFVPHVTLAEGLGPSDIGAAVTALRHWRATVTVTRLLVLVQQPDRRWVPLGDAPLGRPVVVGRGGLPFELAVGAVLDDGAVTLLAAARWADDPQVGGPGLPAGPGGWPGLPAGPGGWPGAAAPLVVTARRGRRVVGVAVAALDGEELWLAAVVTDPAERGAGIGARLVRELEYRAAEAGGRRAWAVVAAAGPGWRWLEGRGWRLERELAGWAHGTDAVRLARPLGGDDDR